MFFDKFNREITIDEFIKCYEPDYFVGTNNKMIRNRTQEYVEKRIERILYSGFKPRDLAIIIGWKTGALSASRSCEGLIFHQDFHNTFSYKGFAKFNASNLVDYICQNFVELQKLAEDDVKELYRRLFDNRLLSNGNKSGVGSVYLFTLIYFFTKGKYPIYDRFAHFALLAYENNLIPNSEKTHLPIYKEISSEKFNESWDYYLEFKNRVDKNFGKYYYNDVRTFDRALWVYGHYYTAKTKNQSC